MLLPLHQWIKSNSKLCAWYNVQIRTKILNLKLVARWVGKERARVHIQTEQILGVYRKTKSVLSPPGCNVLCLKIILASKRRLFGVSRKPEWITDTSISVEACPGEQNVDLREDQCWFVVWNVSVLWIDLPGVFLFLRCKLCCRYDKVYHVVACTGVLGIDSDMSPRSVDCRWSLGVGASIASRP